MERRGPESSGRPARRSRAVVLLAGAPPARPTERLFRTSRMPRPDPPRALFLSVVGIRPALALDRTALAMHPAVRASAVGTRTSTRIGNSRIYVLTTRDEARLPLHPHLRHQSRETERKSFTQQPRPGHPELLHGKIQSPQLPSRDARLDDPIQRLGARRPDRLQGHEIPAFRADHITRVEPWDPAPQGTPHPRRSSRRRHRQRRRRRPRTRRPTPPG